MARVVRLRAEPGPLQGCEHPRSRAELRHRLDARACGVGAAGLRIRGRPVVALRRHLPQQLHEDGSAHRHCRSVDHRAPVGRAGGATRHRDRGRRRKRVASRCRRSASTSRSRSTTSRSTASSKVSTTSVSRCATSPTSPRSRPHARRGCRRPPSTPEHISRSRCTRRALRRRYAPRTRRGRYDGLAGVEQRELAPAPEVVDLLEAEVKEPLQLHLDAHELVRRVVMLGFGPEQREELHVQLAAWASRRARG